VVRAGEGVAQRFRNAIRTLTVDTGSGNSGAAGIQFMANNQGTMRGVEIVSGDGQGTIGLDLAYNNEIGPQLIRDLRVVGFDYGVKTAYAVNSMTFENVVLDGQNEAGIYNASQVFSVNGLTSRNVVPAVVNTYDTEHADTDDDAGVLTILDAKLKSTEHGKPSQPAIENEAGLYARDVVTPGYAAAIENAAGHETDVGSRSVREFTSHGTFNELPLPRRRFKSLRLPVEPSPRVPWDPVSEWANPEDYGGDPDDDVYFYVVTGVSEGGLESVDSPQRVVRTVESPLEAYYPLDYQPEGFAYDAGGLGRDATPEGGVTTGVDGAVNAAYSFDGEDDKLSTPGLVINDTEFTVAT
jgi:hypothetical protein